MSADHNPFALAHARERAVRTLANAFASSVLDEEQLDERMEALVHAEDLATVERLVVHLEPAPELNEGVGQGAIARQDSQALARRPVVSLDTVADERRIITFLGEHEQRGAWTPARRNKMITVLGSGTLDMRDARLAPGVTEIDVRCALAELTIIVPPGLQVEVECTSILSSVEHDERFGDFDPSAPSIRVTGLALLSSIEIKEREEGESGWDARKRRWRSRKQLKKHRQERRALRKGRREGRDS